MAQPSAETTSESSGSADPRRWLALAVIAAAQLLVVLDASVVNIALPSAQQALGMSDVAKQWVVTGYSLTFGGLLLLGGKLADLHGRKRLFIAGLVGFALASAVGGLAQNTETLLAARAVQGGFAAFLAPAGLALLVTTFTNPAELGKAFGIFGAAVGTGGVVGMVLGGVLTEYGSWRWCLLINLPVVLLILIAAVRVLRDSRASGPVRYDLPGTVTGTLGVGALIYGISQAVERGWLSLPTLAFVLTGLVLLGAFVWIEHRSDAPMMPLRVVRDRVRGSGYAVVFLIGGALYAFYLFLTYYLQVVQDYTPLRTGLAFVPIGVGIFVGSVVAGRLLGRFSARVVVITGLVAGVLGIGWLGFIDPTTGFWTTVMPAQLVVGLGIGAALTTVMKLTLDGINPDDSGVASALTNAMREIGGAVGISALNVVAISVTAAAGPLTDGALTDGYATAFLVSAAVLAVATLLAVFAVKPDRVAH
ncbi:EmrB/QacA subfamily drug resistance transporter [Saccharothrix ecbatanensis]|uniref:EmrB/QacA subfamily drug resistance transporter n=1 Tax=Saccharothrix ecbatanensis TaxID=1105145 RepID=A0A7W9M126_9PSEU|nr:MFS transporter [Saccharothrix ecbatanensis]MBB5803397.1 EmrB/QacA subfamily drug resistance transporter [Saccharothrix ecbatanensis]